MVSLDDITRCSTVYAPPTFHVVDQHGPEINGLELGKYHDVGETNATGPDFPFGSTEERKIVVSRETLALIASYAVHLVHSTNKYLDSINRPNSTSS